MLPYTARVILYILICFAIFGAEEYWMPRVHDPALQIALVCFEAVTLTGSAWFFFWRHIPETPRKTD